MPEEPQSPAADDAEGQDDGGESEFWNRFDQGLEKHLGDAKFDAALDRWLAKADQELQQEEAAGRQEKTSGETKDAPTGAAPDDRGGSDAERGVSDAERKRDAGRHGRRAPSPYWERVKGFIFDR